MSLFAIVVDFVVVEDVISILRDRCDWLVSSFAVPNVLNPPPKKERVTFFHLHVNKECISCVKAFRLATCGWRYCPLTNMSTGANSYCHYRNNWCAAVCRCARCNEVKTSEDEHKMPLVRAPNRRHHNEDSEWWLFPSCRWVLRQLYPLPTLAAH